MNLKQASQLHNRDEVQVRTPDGDWEQGYVLGEPQQSMGRIMVPTQSPNGFHWVDQVDVR